MGRADCTSGDPAGVVLARCGDWDGEGGGSHAFGFPVFWQARRVRSATGSTQPRRERPAACCPPDDSLGDGEALSSPDPLLEMLWTNALHGPSASGIMPQQSRGRCPGHRLECGEPSHRNDKDQHRSAGDRAPRQPPPWPDLSARPRVGVSGRTVVSGAYAITGALNRSPIEKTRDGDGHASTPRGRMRPVIVG
jgi:hypothetical protein